MEGLNEHLNGTSAFAARSMTEMSEKIRNATARAGAVATALADTCTPTMHHAVSSEPGPGVGIGDHRSQDIAPSALTGETSRADSSGNPAGSASQWCTKEKIYLGLAIVAILLIGGVAIAFSVVALRKITTNKSTDNRGSENGQVPSEDVDHLPRDSGLVQKHWMQGNPQTSGLQHVQQYAAPQYDQQATNTLNSGTTKTSSISPTDMYVPIPRQPQYESYIDGQQEPPPAATEPQYATGQSIAPPRMYPEREQQVDESGVVDYASADDIQLPSEARNVSFEGQMAAPPQYGDGSPKANYDSLFQQSATGGPMASDNLDVRR